MYKKILTRLFPDLCGNCLKETTLGYCVLCQKSLPWLAHQCLTCAKPLIETKKCFNCNQSPPHYKTAFTPFVYEGLIAKHIQNLKYNNQLHYAYVIGLAFANWARRTKIPLPDLIVPIPMERSRIRKRGFNQSTEIAKVIGRQLAIPVDWKTLSKIKNTPPQASLSSQERSKYISDSFLAKGEHNKNKQIVIFDDVITSGMTVHNAAKAFVEKDFNSLTVWAIAHTKLHKHQ